MSRARCRALLLSGLIIAAAAGLGLLLGMGLDKMWP